MVELSELLSQVVSLRYEAADPSLELGPKVSILIHNKGDPNSPSSVVKRLSSSLGPNKRSRQDPGNSLGRMSKPL